MPGTAASVSQTVLNTGTLIQFYTDPEGKQIELQVDNYDTSEETQHIQRTQGTRIPIPKEHLYDAETMPAMVAAGVPDRDLFDHGRYRPHCVGPLFSRNAGDAMPTEQTATRIPVHMPTSGTRRWPRSPRCRSRATRATGPR